MAQRRRRQPRRQPRPQTGALNYPQYEWALNADGQPVHITEAARGAIYACPLCQGRMVARQGDIIRHHFAHSELSTCPPDEVARIAAARWLTHHIEGCITTHRAITSTWRCPLCQHTHTTDLLAGIATVQRDVPIGAHRADVALLDGAGRVRTVIAVRPPDRGTLTAFTHAGLTTLAVDTSGIRHEVIDLAALLSGSTIHNGACATQQAAAQNGVITDVPTMRTLITQAVSRPPYYVYGPLERHGDLTHVFTMGDHKLWLPPILWQQAIGGVLHSISPALQIISQEWAQPDGGTIALYYVSVKGAYAIAARRFAPGQAVYARLDTSVFRTPRVTATHIARSFAER